jgi:hypothetical protein
MPVCRLEKLEVQPVKQKLKNKNPLHHDVKYKITILVKFNIKCVIAYLEGNKSLGPKDFYD